MGFFLLLDSLYVSLLCNFDFKKDPDKFEMFGQFTTICEIVL